jgi:hypothetical protein
MVKRIQEPTINTAIARTSKIGFPVPRTDKARTITVRPPPEKLSAANRTEVLRLTYGDFTKM